MLRSKLSPLAPDLVAEPVLLRAEDMVDPTSVTSAEGEKLS